MKFTHLHLHTNYSVLDGAIKIPELARHLKKLEMDSCAMTDHGAMFGAVKFCKEMKKRGIKPIIGCEVYMTPGSRFDRTNDRFHLILLCQDGEGYRNLSKLVTHAYVEGFYYKPRVDVEILEKHNKGIIALSGCLKGEIPELLLSGREEEARNRAKWYRDVFAERYYLELQDNGIEEQYLINEKLIKLSRELDIPIVATNDCHYISKKDAFIQEVLICISTKKTLEDKKRLKMSTDEFYLKTEEEMQGGFFKDYPEAITNTAVISEQCNFSFKTGVHYLPVVGKDEEEGKDIIEKLACVGLKSKKIEDGKRDIYEKRLRHELDIIKGMGFSSYYLIVANFIRWAKDNSIPVGPGRGSGAASLVAYALGITDLDPIRYDLIFERFLNPERVGLPDFDIDFCSRRRDDVFEYLVERYGREFTTKIATFGFLKARSAIKDVGRVLGYPYKEVDDLTKMVPGGPDIGSLQNIISREPELKKAMNRDEKIKNLLEIANAIEGSIRNVGIHAGGVIISSIPVVELVPLIPAKDSVIATQFDMEDIKEIGLVKFDLLAIETLTVIDDTIRYIRKFKDPGFDIENVALNDPKVFELLAKGDTLGVFQLESTGMQKLLRDIQPDCFEDIIAVNALYRPGPLSGGMVDQYINRKHGKEKIDYQFPELEPILKETCGIIVYQEQVQRIASVLAGYSLGEADLLRIAMGDKKPAEMAAQKERFVAGAAALGYDAKKVDNLFELMAKFAEYGFNKAHAAVYALNAYRTAYLKCYCPVEFLSALLTAKIGKQKFGQSVEAVTFYMADAVAHGINVLPPDVNESMYDFEPRGSNIRFGMAGIKNIGRAAIDNILEERASGNLFKGFVDFCTRVDTRKVNRKTLEQLIKAGAFDSFGVNRGILWNNMDKVMDFASDRRREIESGQCNLFGEASVGEENESVLDLNVENWDNAKNLQFEREAVGFYISSHPLNAFEYILRASGVPEIFSIQHIPPENKITAAGVLSFIKEIKTKTGGHMGIFSLEDKTGSIGLVAFSNNYKKVKGACDLGSKPVLCYGRISSESGVNKIIVERIKRIEERDFVFSIRARGDHLSKDELESILKIVPKNSGVVRLNMEIVFPNEGSVTLDIGNASLSDCDTTNGRLKELANREISVKWSLG